MIDSTDNRYKVKRGEQLPQSKLTDNDVKNIHALVKIRNKLKRELSTLTNKAIAEKFEVHYRTIDRVTVGMSWSHISPESKNGE